MEVGEIRDFTSKDKNKKELKLWFVE